MDLRRVAREMLETLGVGNGEEVFPEPIRGFCECCTRGHRRGPGGKRFWCIFRM